jgi:hypothetical protein
MTDRLNRDLVVASYLTMSVIEYGNPNGGGLTWPPPPAVMTYGMVFGPNGLHYERTDDTEPGPLVSLGPHVTDLLQWETP